MLHPSRELKLQSFLLGNMSIKMVTVTVTIGNSTSKFLSHNHLSPQFRSKLLCTQNQISYFGPLDGKIPPALAVLKQ